MLQAALADGTAHRRCVFEVFTRRLPAGRRYGVLAGTGRVLESLDRFRFGAAELDWLARRAAWSTTPRWRSWPTTGSPGRSSGYAEGEVVLPVVARHGGRGHVRRGRPARDARAVDPQLRLGGRVGGVPDDQRGGRPPVPGDGLAARARGGGGRGGPGGGRRGLRRHVEPRGRAALRAADDRHGRARVHAPARRRGGRVRRAGRRRWASGTTLLVDTYDVRRGVELALAAAGTGLGAVRLDSGDLGVLAHEVRAQLDAGRRAGARRSR